MDTIKKKLTLSDSKYTRQQLETLRNLIATQVFSDKEQALTTLNNILTVKEVRNGTSSVTLPQSVIDVFQTMLKRENVEK